MRRWMHAKITLEEIERDANVIQQLNAARREEVKTIESQLDRVVAASREIIDQAIAIKRRYKAGGQPLPVPLFTESRIADLQESLIVRGNVDGIRMMEEIREQLSFEDGSPVRTAKEVGRLQAQLFVAESRLHIERESLGRFEETKHRSKRAEQ